MSVDVANLQVRLVPVEEVVPYSRNARTHPPEHVEQIARSIREFGWTNPILIDGNGQIIAGHGRHAAARLLGLRRVPVIVLDGLSEAQKRALVIADNKLTDNSSFDLDLLKIELVELQEEGFDLSLTFFSPEELEDLLVEELPLDEGDPDAAPEAQEQTVSVPGDVWVLGEHRVMCGDSTSIDAWDRLMRGEKADCVWTDPPYNVDYGEKNKSLEQVGKGVSSAGSIGNDKLKDADFLEFLTEAFSAVFAVMQEGAPIYVAHSDLQGLAFRQAFARAGFSFSGCLVWKKNVLVLGRSDYQWIHEPILYGWKPGAKHPWYGGRDKTTVIEEAKPSRSADHPTMKPVALIERMLRNSAKRGDIIVDAFGGSGSTLIAAHRLGMRARLMELDPKFCDVIVRRWQEITGAQAVHAESGELFDQRQSSNL